MKRKLLLGFASLTLAACAGGFAPSQKTLNERLVQAAQTGQNQEVMALIKAGADLEGHDAEGFTPYLAAASTGQLSTMKLLKGMGAKTTVDEKFEDTRFIAQLH